MAEYKIPKKVKYREQQRGRRSGFAKRGTTIAFGEYALQATESASISRKQHRGGRSGFARRGTTIAFEEYALKATEAAWISGKQIEAGRVAITRFVKRGGQLWIALFPVK